MIRLEIFRKIEIRRDDTDNVDCDLLYTYTQRIYTFTIDSLSDLLVGSKFEIFDEVYSIIDIVVHYKMDYTKDCLNNISIDYVCLEVDPMSIIIPYQKFKENISTEEFDKLHFGNEEEYQTLDMLQLWLRTLLKVFPDEELCAIGFRSLLWELCYY